RHHGAAQPRARARTPPGSDAATRSGETRQSPPIHSPSRATLARAAPGAAPEAAPVRGAADPGTPPAHRATGGAPSTSPGDPAAERGRPTPGPRGPAASSPPGSGRKRDARRTAGTPPKDTDTRCRSRGCARSDSGQSDATRGSSSFHREENYYSTPEHARGGKRPDEGQEAEWFRAVRPHPGPPRARDGKSTGTLLRLTYPCVDKRRLCSPTAPSQDCPQRCPQERPQRPEDGRADGCATHEASPARGPRSDAPGAPKRHLTAASRCASSSAHRSGASTSRRHARSEEHTSELQSRENLVCRLLLEKKKK